ncbi:response regulator transcription factor [Streptomyces naganishii]|uniref:Helix-turn-helix transcriptional regulator n=1 Tax=Streptomyces naganishii JCM 4654 TaxID=1306179 RepID=A0A918Y501_9ACTN|nr:helix-turn-helix transcriptional regulator [Streptomyces naganishii]GHD90794.1 helix-turn-helix transcriptional regulator [Streptomyces naganishii JCM 4654]
MTANASGTVEIRAALVRLRRATGLPVAFGGLVEPGRPRVRISELTGTSTLALRALAVTSGNGLGGKAVALARPCAVTDYSLSRQISHEYDVPVAAEGLRSVLAVPVVVRRRVRGVLYGALRTAQPLGDRTLSAAVAAARDVEQALVVREAARDLLAAARPLPAAEAAGPGAEWSGAAWEEVREAHRELRSLAPRVADPALRAEVLGVCRRLAGAAPADLLWEAGEAREAGRGVAGEAGADGCARAAGLSPRELDVLAYVAAGATNAAVAARLGVRAETVKGYLRSAMRKLAAHTRGEAVVSARRAGLLP